METDSNIGPSVGDKLKAILTEYESLRLEILNRIKSQTFFIQIHVIALTSIIGGIISQKIELWVLFLIPIESSIIGLWYLDHSRRIIIIGEYIQKHIEPTVCRLAKEDQIMNWETNVAKGTYENAIVTFFKPRFLRLLTFGGPSFLSLLIIIYIFVAYSSEFNRFFPVKESISPIFLSIVWVIGFILTVMYFYNEKQRSKLFLRRKK